MAVAAIAGGQLPLATGAKGWTFRRHATKETRERNYWGEIYDTLAVLWREMVRKSRGKQGKPPKMGVIL